MANIFMQSGALAIVDRSIDLIADTLKVALCKSNYVADPDNVFIDAGGANDVVDARVTGTTDQTLASKTLAKDDTGNFAYLDAADITYTAVPSGTAATQAVVYKSTGTDTTSKILAVHDIPDVTPNGR